MKRTEGIINNLLFETKFQVLKLLNLGNRLTRNSKIKNYFKTHEKIKIHFGGGSEKLDGFLNTDILGKIPINISKKLPFPDQSVDIIYSCHVIEHLYYKDFKFFMKEAHRVLKEDGLHIIMTPSLEKLFEILYHKEELKPILLRGHEKLAREKLNPALLINKMIHIYYGHRFLHDFESIYNVALRAGFSKIKKISFGEIPDVVIKEYAQYRANRGMRWKLETETFLLGK
ncbi:MAG: methyltransferase domain-containing protein [Candidatus Lokiarchaeota archaeon]|nr:methyltransferase domain-containing protein [Candidatus Lokiarchaeota archaeon]